ncbi:MAG: hypothetical protein MUF78_00380 [Candidatus Edwardsbacteria bacterium]|jgi:hypothetical protein|nr:hypothetical protein [Candidatus Edwardsbacteria bacterium]
MNRAHSLATILAGALLLSGSCSRQPGDAGFTSKTGMKLDSLPAAAPADTAAKRVDPATMHGFSVEASGAVELHFYDSEDRHTGPATAEEYLPVVQLALSNPNLHPQERTSLEEMKARMQETGSAGEFAVTRRIPNFKYTLKDGETRAEFTGGDVVELRIRAVGADQARLNLRVWNDRQLRRAAYALTTEPGQSGELAVSSTMDDFAIGWDGGSGKIDREIAPAALDSQTVPAK